MKKKKIKNHSSGCLDYHHDMIRTLAMLSVFCHAALTCAVTRASCSQTSPTSFLIVCQRSLMTLHVSALLLLLLLLGECHVIAHVCGQPAGSHD